MEQKLIDELSAIMQKVTTNQTLNEKELVTVKNAFEEITGSKVITMMSCNGQLCEVFKRVLTNFLKAQEVKEVLEPIIAKKIIIEQPILNKVLAEEPIITQKIQKQFKKKGRK